MPEAIESYDKALELRPTVEKIWSNKGLALAKMKRTGESIDLQKIASSLQIEEKEVVIPVMPEAATEKSVPLNINKGTEPLKPDPGKNTVTGKSKEYLIKGNAFFNEKKYAEAIDFFDISLQLESNNCITWNNKGLALAREGKYDEALICYDKALEIDPDDYVYLNNKGNALYKKGDFKSAIKIFGLAFERNPENMTSIRGMELCIKSLKNINALVIG